MQNFKHEFIGPFWLAPWVQKETERYENVVKALVCGFNSSNASDQNICFCKVNNEKMCYWLQKQGKNIKSLKKYKKLNVEQDEK